METVKYQATSSVANSYAAVGRHRPDDVWRRARIVQLRCFPKRICGRRRGCFLLLVDWKTTLRPRIQRATHC